MKKGGPVKLSDEYRSMLAELTESREHLFITGRAGTGKSTLLRLFAKTVKKNVVIVAPTGVAALNAGGQTIHSFFHFPPTMLDRTQIKRAWKTKIYRKLDILIIDEISMVRADMIDQIDWFLKLNRNSQRPFGGVRLVMFGDLYQIPPVVRMDEAEILKQRGYESPYFFSSEAFTEHTSFVMHELTKVYRQRDQRFIGMLDQIRQGYTDYDLLEEMNERVTKVRPPQPYITLTATNKVADAINRYRLDELDVASIRFSGKIEGKFIEQNCPSPLILECKVGAQVILLRNDPDLEYVNGSLGTIVAIREDEVDVRLSGKEKKVVTIKRHEWEVNKYVLDDKGKVVTEKIGAYIQMPFKLAWAITIHKSQGKTFDRILVDLGRGAFAPGQTYVALSRARSLEGVYLNKELKPDDIIVDPFITEVLDDMRR